ncbi:MAG: TatD family deoxyribonuclease [SAR202 cluster bacterium]|nr:TatD family deoxyribonuclease [SAR202 cluster bacterium]
MFIDTHAHIHQHNPSEVPGIIERAVQKNVGAILTAGTTVVDSREAIELAQRQTRVFAGIGIHPTEITNPISEDQLSQLEGLATAPQVVVMSEIGIDHQGTSPDKDWQEESFYAQIKIAREHKLPLIFHIREQDDDYDAHSARDAALSILKETGAGDIGGSAHYFQGRWSFAEKLLDLGFNISFAKTLTKIADLEETAKKTPTSRLLLETDAYPQTFKKNRAKWTEPRDISLVSEKLAALRNVTTEYICRTTTENTLAMLGARGSSVKKLLTQHNPE